MRTLSTPNAANTRTLRHPLLKAIAGVYRRSCYLADPTCLKLAAGELRKEIRAKLNLSLDQPQAIKLLTQ